MELTSYERDAQQGRLLFIGVGHYGETKIAGPVTSCAIMVDYDKVTPALIDAVLAQHLTKEVAHDIAKSLKIFGSYLVPAKTINVIKDLNITTHLAEHASTMEAVFNGFKVLRADPQLIVSHDTIREVVKNEDVAIHTGKAKSEYVMHKDWNQFSQLIPNIKFKVEKQETFTLLYARALAKRFWDANMEGIRAKYPGYNLCLDKLDEHETSVLSTLGMTIQHRHFLPEMKQFTFAHNMLI